MNKAELMQLNNLLNHIDEKTDLNIEAEQKLHHKKKSDHSKVLENNSQSVSEAIKQLILENPKETANLRYKILNDTETYPDEFVEAVEWIEESTMEI